MYITKKASDNNVYFHFALKKKVWDREIAQWMMVLAVCVWALVGDCQLPEVVFCVCLIKLMYERKV